MRVQARLLTDFEFHKHSIHHSNFNSHYILTLYIPHSNKFKFKIKIRLNKKQRKIREQQLKQLDNSIPSSSDGSTQLPANLRRKIEAKRPVLGHVVPEQGRKLIGGTGSGGGTSGGTGSGPGPSTGGTGGAQLRSQGKARADGYNNPSNLKILGGVARGRRLDSPEVYLRPMMGKVKEAVYSTFTAFGFYSTGVNTKHLDIFSGSGSVGLESLSRGAQHCTFVDLARDCCDTCQRNINKCEFGEDPEMTRVINADAIAALRDPFSFGIPQGFTYNLVTLCPPYEEIVYADLIEAAANSPVVTDDTVILIEYPIELGCLPHVISREDGGALVGLRNRKYGRTVIAMYVVNPTGRLDSSAESRPEEFISL